MKRSYQRSKTISVLAILVFFSVLSNGFASSDFFPIDIWEELDAWEQNINTIYGFKVESSKLSSESFPFDVNEELNNMGGIELLNFSIQLSMILWIVGELLVAAHQLENENQQFV